MLTKVNTTEEPLIIERTGGNIVVLPQSDYDQIIAFIQNKKKEQDEYTELRNVFFKIPDRPCRIL